MLIISRADALELFCQVVRRYESDPRNKEPDDILSVEEFTSKDFIDRALENYRKSTYCAAVSAQIFKKEIKESEAKGSSKFYNMVKQIRELEMVTINEGDLNCYLKFINDQSFTEKALSYKRLIVEEWKTNYRQFAFQETIWWLYYYDVDKQGRSGVCRAILCFETFGRARIINYSVSREKIENYTGYYSMIYNNDLIKMEMKLEGVDKDLHLLFFVGPGNEDDITFSMGQYHNFHHKIYSGVVIISRLPKGAQQQMKIKIEQEIKAKEKEWNKLSNDVKLFIDVKEKPESMSQNIWNFLTHKLQNLIEVPCDVITESDLSALDESRTQESKKSPSEVRFSKKK